MRDEVEKCPIGEEVEGSNRAYLFDRNREALQAARDSGFIVVLPDDHTLQLDIDSAEDLEAFQDNFELFDKFIGVHSVMTVPSKSGDPDHHHVTIKLTRKWGLNRRIAFQAILGSHRKRELLNILRAINHVEDPIAFFEKGEE